MGSLTHFAHSFVGRLKFMSMCSCCKRVKNAWGRFVYEKKLRRRMPWKWPDKTITNAVLELSSEVSLGAIRDTAAVLFCLSVHLSHHMSDMSSAKLNTQTQFENLLVVQFIGGLICRWYKLQYTPTVFGIYGWSRQYIDMTSTGVLHKIIQWHGPMWRIAWPLW